MKYFLLIFLITIFSISIVNAVSVSENLFPSDGVKQFTLDDRTFSVSITGGRNAWNPETKRTDLHYITFNVDGIVKEVKESDRVSFGDISVTLFDWGGNDDTGYGGLIVLDCGNCKNAEVPTQPTTPGTPNQPSEPAKPTCIEYKERKCYDGKPWWYDSCGNKHIVAERCEYDEQCVEGYCQKVQEQKPQQEKIVCVSQAQKKCDFGDVYWYNSCNMREDKYEDCGSGTCNNGRCVIIHQVIEEQKEVEPGYNKPREKVKNVKEPTQDKTEEKSVVKEQKLECGFFERLFGACKQDETIKKIISQNDINPTSEKIPADKKEGINFRGEYPVIFVHGHSPKKGEPKKYLDKYLESLKSGNPKFEQFNDLQNELDRDGLYEDKGLIIPGQNIKDICEKQDWSKGSSVVTTYYLDNGELKINVNQPLESYAQRLAKSIEILKLCTRSSKVDIVAHSMGGLVAREYARTHELSINRLITIATPNKGTGGDVPSFCKTYGYGEGDIACQQMKSGSEFLNKLNLINDNAPSKEIEYYTIGGILKNNEVILSACVNVGNCNDGVVCSKYVELLSSHPGNVKNYVVATTKPSSFFGGVSGGIHSDMIEPLEGGDAGKQTYSILKSILEGNPQRPNAEDYDDGCIGNTKNNPTGIFHKLFGWTQE